MTQPRRGAAVVEVLGEHDLGTRDEGAGLFLRLVAENDLVVIDLTEAAFIDSSFLNNLIQARAAALERGSIVRLQVGTAPIVKRMLEVSNFLTHFEHAETREEALAERELCV